MQYPTISTWLHVSVVEVALVVSFRTHVCDVGCICPESKRVSVLIATVTEAALTVVDGDAAAEYSRLGVQASEDKGRREKQRQGLRDIIDCSQDVLGVVEVGRGARWRRSGAGIAHVARRRGFAFRVCRCN